jgi:hypothetical protein
MKRKMRIGINKDICKERLSAGSIRCCAGNQHVFGMKSRFHVFLLVFLLLAAQVYSQEAAPAAKKHLTFGLTYNPFLAIMQKKQELGPAVSFGYPVSRRLEAGISCFSRQVLHVSDNAYRQLSNLRSSYNLESVYSIYFGINFLQKKLTHTVSAAAGIRHDLYKEALDNPLYEISQTYRNSEWNMVYGLSYTCKYGLSDRSALSLRFFMPLNRHPFDDVIRYSAEPGFVFNL